MFQAPWSRRLGYWASLTRRCCTISAYIHRRRVRDDIDDFESTRTEALRAHESGLKANSAYWQAHTSFLLTIAEIRLNRIAEGEKWYEKGSKLLKSLGKLADMRSPLSILSVLAQAHLMDAKGDWANRQGAILAKYRVLSRNTLGSVARSSRPHPARRGRTGERPHQGSGRTVHESG